MVKFSSSSTKVQHAVKPRRRLKHVPTHVAAFCGIFCHDQDTEGQSMGQTSSPADFILAHPRDIALHWTSLEGIETSDSLIATYPTSPLLPRNVSFDENDALRTPRLESTISIRPVSALAQRISLRPRTLPTSVDRSLGVSLRLSLDAEAAKLNTMSSSFVWEHDEKEQSGFATPKRRSSFLDHRVPLVLRRKDLTTDDFLSSPRPVPCHLFIPDDL
jgi:hypothetical protein